ncbi:MAG: toxin-antitoxin system YwqK family antitoxin [Cytophagaceae bacterium]|jgi:antitoxin component YwqK of YwqJK toxin-antitoxin module|nr:toxin-antitoxin system YwqK family antitoxin [Cytophagaceae bacterium]
MIKEIFYVSIKNNLRDSVYTSYYFQGTKKSEGNFSQGKTIGEWKYYYENGQIKMKGQLIHSIKTGKWEYFYENGILQMVGASSGSIKEGEWIFYFENGAIRARGNFLNGKKEGQWMYYYEDGSMKALATFSQDNGTYMEYYPGGGLKAQGEIKNGQSNGEWIYYAEDGSIQSRGIEVNGLKEGEWVTYHPNGTVAAKGMYKNGKPIGNWTYYYDNGTVSEEGQISADGVKEGVWKMYYRNGQYKGESVFVNGEGEYKEFYENGKLKATGKVIQDVNEGTWKYYYPTGELEGTCFYVNGEGQYKGYYENGKLKMEGRMRNGENIGLWTIYNEDGSVAGYYKTYYEAIQNQILPDSISSTSIVKDTLPVTSSLPKISLPKKKSRYFTSRINESRAFIVSTNPLYLLFFSFPLSIEYYLQERQGFEFGLLYFRKPMFKSHSNISPGNLYNIGYEGFVRHRFYQKEKDFGMLYFAYEIRGSYFIYENNYKDVSIGVVDPVPLSQQHTRVEMSFLLGNRLLEDQRRQCWTLDAYLGIGIGYQSVQKSWEGDRIEYDRLFSGVNENAIVFPFRFGFTAGYKFNRNY